jgi:hypothetical protein
MTKNPPKQSGHRPKPGPAPVDPPVPPKRGPNYPWEDWADGVQRRAVRGEDFHNTPESFANAGARWARENGHTWAASIDYPPVPEPTDDVPNPVQEDPTTVVFTITRGVQ